MKARYLEQAEDVDSSFIRAEGLIPRRLRRIKGIRPDCNTL